MVSKNALIDCGISWRCSVKVLKKRKLTVVSLICFLILSICGCGNKNNDGKDNSTESVSETEREELLESTTEVTTELTTDEEITEELTTQEQLDNKKEIRVAYKEALKNLYNNHVFPDGSEAECLGGDGENLFAIFDVDLDGIDELIVEWKTASMAGMRFAVYQYDVETKECYQELSATPGCVDFYDNGIVISGAAHNQGKGAELWPYTIYQYDSTLDMYKDVGFVDSWEKQLCPDGYPEEYDVDDAGVVYMINYLGYNKDYYCKSEYENFYQQLFEDNGTKSKQIKYDFFVMNEETICDLSE